MRSCAAVIFLVRASCPGLIRLAWCLSNGPHMLSRTWLSDNDTANAATRHSTVFSRPVLNNFNCITDKELEMGEEDLPTTECPSLPNGVKRAPPPKKKNYWRQFLAHLRTEISIDHADIPIIACCLVSGLCDSSAYNAWTCFVSMQTGKSPPNAKITSSRLTFIR